MENNNYAEIIADPIETTNQPKKKRLNKKVREGLIGYGFASLWLIGIALFPRPFQNKSSLNNNA